jgi:hypothetical protein
MRLRCETVQHTSHLPNVVAYAGIEKHGFLWHNADGLAQTSLRDIPTTEPLGGLTSGSRYIPDILPID